MDLLQITGSSSTLLQELLAGLPQAVVLTDLEGRILFANRMAERLTGYEADRLKDQDLSIFFTREDLGYLYPNLFYLARRRQPFEGEVMLQRKNGAKFFAFLYFTPCSDPSDGRTVISVSFQDIDRQKSLEKVIRETHFEDLVKVANGIAHELRNPLVGIGGFVNRLYKVCAAGEETERYYNYIINNIKKIDNLVKKVDLLVSLPKPDLTQEQISGLIEAAAATYRERIAAKQIEFINKVGEEKFLVDKNLFVKAFSILIENALDALSPGGRIVIDSETQENQCRVEVADTGAGISSENLPHIFNPFFSTKADGSGIDLAVVKRIMEGHGGRLGVESAVGQGTRFCLFFPLERRRQIRISLFSE